VRRRIITCRCYQFCSGPSQTVRHKAVNLVLGSSTLLGHPTCRRCHLGLGITDTKDSARAAYIHKEGMEKDILSNLKALEREGRKQLASLRKSKRAGRNKQTHTHFMSDHLRARKSGQFSNPDSELFAVNRLLDRDDLSAEDRKAFSARRRILIRVGA